MRGLEVELQGMTWYGALVAVILTMIGCANEKRRRFDPAPYTTSELTRMAGEAVHNRRDREIILARLTDGISHERLAEMFDLSVAQIKRIVYRAENALAKMS